MNRKDRDNQRQTRPLRLAALSVGIVTVLCCAAAEAQTVRVWAGAVVNADQIRLRDVASADGFDPTRLDELNHFVVAEAPRPGQSLAISLEAVREALRRGKVNMATLLMNGAGECIVRRPVSLPEVARVVGKASHQLVGPTLREHVIRHLRESLDGYGGHIDVTFPDTSRSLLDFAGPADMFDVRLVGRRRLGKIDLQITVSKESEPPQVLLTSAVVNMKREVVVAARILERGRIISRNDVIVEERAFEKLEHIPTLAITEVIGQQVKRTVRVGSFVRSSDIKSVTLVQRKEVIRVRSAGSGIVLESTARALESGVLGDFIEVRNEVSAKTFRVRVTGLRQAEIVSTTAAMVAALQEAGGKR